MGHEPVDAVGFATCRIKHFVRNLIEHIDSQLEHRLAIHFKCGITQHITATKRPGRAQNIGVLPICVQTRGHEARSIGRLQDHGTGVWFRNMKLRVLTP